MDSVRCLMRETDEMLQQQREDERLSEVMERYDDERCVVPTYTPDDVDISCTTYDDGQCSVVFQGRDPHTCVTVTFPSNVDAVGFFLELLSE